MWKLAAGLSAVSVAAAIWVAAMLWAAWVEAVELLHFALGILVQ